MLLRNDITYIILINIYEPNFIVCYILKIILALNNLRCTKIPIYVLPLKYKNNVIKLPFLIHMDSESNSEASGKTNVKSADSTFGSSWKRPCESNAFDAEKPFPFARQSENTSSV